MERVNKILKHALFIENLEKNAAAEADRRFCRHDMTHFLDVARIGWILALEEKQTISREMIYAAALLHDLGKHRQYSQGIAHEQASALIAEPILRDCGFQENEIELITDAILQHRREEAGKEKNLRGLLYRADKASRPCYACQAEAACDWKGSKKNLQLAR